MLSVAPCLVTPRSQTSYGSGDVQNELGLLITDLSHGPGCPGMAPRVEAQNEGIEQSILLPRQTEDGTESLAQLVERPVGSSYRLR